jgi:hypothetical protein
MQATKAVLAVDELLADDCELDPASPLNTTFVAEDAPQAARLAAQNTAAPVAANRIRTG